MKNNNKLTRFLVAIIAVAIIVTIALLIFIFTSRKDIIYVNGTPVHEDFKFLVDEPAEEVNSYDSFRDQVEINNNIRKKFKKGKYTINDPLVIVDPYNVSPQTALVMFKTNKKEKVTITLKGKHNDDIVTTFEADREHVIPVYGLYEKYDNKVVIKSESGVTNTITIKIGEVNYAGEVNVITNEVENKNGEFYFGTAAIGSPTIAYDKYGEIRWRLAIDYSKGFTFLKNGNMLLANIGIGPEINSQSGLVEIDLFGYIHREYELEGGYHHECIELENGDLAVTTADPNSFTLEDVIAVIDRKTGQNKKLFKLYDIVSAIDKNLIGRTDITWGWINGLFYDKAHNEMIISMRNMNSVVGLDYDTGKINWILGDISNWSDKFSDYIIKGFGQDFSYTLGQHSPQINSNGDLMIFNNGYNAHNEKAVSCVTLKNNASYGMIYRIDRVNKTAEVLYRFGGVDYFSYALSNYNETFDGNTIFNSGWHFADESVFNNPNCTQFTADAYNSTIIEFDKNNNKILEMKVDESKFEVVKAPVYHLSYASVKPDKSTIVPNYVFDDKAYYTTSKSQDEYEVLNKEDALEYKSNELCPISFELINRQFGLVGDIPDEFDFKVTFISTKGVAYRFTLKEANGLMKSTVNLKPLPNDRYYIYVNMDKFVYDTRAYIDLN